MPSFFDKIFGVPKIEDITQFLANHLPPGRLWNLKNESSSNIHKLLMSVSSEYQLLFNKIAEMATEFNIDNTFLLLSDWEKSVGIPDGCIDIPIDDLAKRKTAVKNRIKKTPFVTLGEIQQYVDDLFAEFDLKLYPGADYFSGYEYQYEFNYIGGVNLKFLLVVEVDQSGDTYEYEYQFEYEAGVNKSQIECALRKVIPANVAIIFEFTAANITNYLLLGANPSENEILIGGDESTLIGSDSG